MEKITNQRKVLSLSFLFMFVYMVSYLTRINYGAVISEMVLAEGISESIASLPLTMSAVTYGCGQLLSGYIGDRVNPKNLIFTGLLITATTNFMMPLCSSPYQMAIIWGINGLAQAFMWPPLVKIMTTIFTGNDYKKVTVRVSCGSAIGTMAVYAFSPVIISFFGWRGVFVISALCALIMAFFLKIKFKFTPQEPISTKWNLTNTTQKFKFEKKHILLIGTIMIAIAFQGFIRDGVATWMPSYISKTFNLSNRIAILTGVVLPIFTVISFYITLFINRKFVKNEMVLAGIMFIIGLLSAILLFFARDKNPYISVFAFAILSAGVHGTNLVLTSLTNPSFLRFGNVSFMSGLLNSCTYVGSAVSGSGLALFSEKFGWNGTVVLWALVALFGGILCFAISNIWKKFSNVCEDL